MDDKVEDGGDADLDQVLPVLQQPRPHLRTRQTLHFEEIGLVETLVDVAKLSEELDSFVPDILVLLVDKEQLGMESDDRLFVHLLVVVVGEQHLLCLDQLCLAIQEQVLDVFPPCYEDEGESEGDEDEEEGSNDLCTAQLIATYLHFVEVADVDAKSPALGLLPRLHLHQVVSQMHLWLSI